KTGLDAADHRRGLGELSAARVARGLGYGPETERRPVEIGQSDHARRPGSHPQIDDADRSRRPDVEHGCRPVEVDFGSCFEDVVEVGLELAALEHREEVAPEDREQEEGDERYAAFTCRTHAKASFLAPRPRR